MCGRIDQRQAGIEYALQMGWEATREVFGVSEAVPRVNAPPGTYRPVLHVADGEQHIDDVFWGYRPFWSASKLIPPNARLDKLLGSYWKNLLKNGRCIVPANGWYEWTGEKGAKLPWHIHSKNHEPLFMAAIANFGTFKEHRAEAGFAIITDDARGGLIDVHDRRPVVFNADDARLWVGAELAPDEARHMLSIAARPPEDFEWYRVGTAVNNARNEAPDLAMPID